MNRGVRILAAVGLLVAILAAGLLVLPSRVDLVVYTASDAVYSQPVREAFERETGLRVALVTDAEASKTTGLYQRLLAERKRPRADVFWNNEISRTLLLARKGLLQPYKPAGTSALGSEFRDPAGRWHGLACRVRVIIYNTKLVTKREAPGSVGELAEERWKGQVAVAYPLFGTTATHFAALRAHPEMGREKANAFFRRLVANKTRVAGGNAIVARLVASGDVKVGLTDTDDAWAMIDKGHPVKIVYPDQRPEEPGALVIPNTASLISGARHPEAARRFLDFLFSEKVETMLAAPPARHLSPRPEGKVAPDARPIYALKPMKVDWKKVADEIESQAPELEKIFPR